MSDILVPEPEVVADIFRDNPDLTVELNAYLDDLPLTDNRDINRGYLIEALHKGQSLFGYLPEPVQLLIANKLGLHLTEVYGVISFYTYFTDKPRGKYQINVCMGTACFVRGAPDLREEFKRYLQVENEETTSDGKYSLGNLRCVGACSLAPVVLVNEKVYGNVTTSKVPDILADCRKDEKEKENRAELEFEADNE